MAHKTKEAQRAQINRWRKANPEKWKAISDKSRAKRKAEGKKPSIEQQRKYHRKWKYGLTIEAFDSMFEGQGRACAACRTETPTTKNKWHIDHCHNSGKVRGILCHVCNTAAGVAGDNPMVLRAIAEYLERTSD